MSKRTAPRRPAPTPTPSSAAGSSRALPSRAALVVAAVAIVGWLAGTFIVRGMGSRQAPPSADVSSLPPAVQADVRAAESAAAVTPAAGIAVGELARTYHAALLTDHAEHTYGLAAQLAPQEAAWPYGRALLLEERGDADRALEAFRRVVSLSADHALAWLRIGDLLFKQGQADEARRAYERARDLPAPPPFAFAGTTTRQSVAPVSAYAEFGLARLAVDRGGVDEARATLERLARGYPRFGAARSLLRSLEATDRQEGTATKGPTSFVPPADPWLDRVVARSNHPDLLLKHAAIATQSGDRAWREFLVRRALAANPRGLDVLLEAAEMSQSVGDHHAAVRYLRDAEQVAPEDHHTQVELGQSLSELNQLDEAEQVLRRAARVRDASAEYNLATVLDRQGKWDEARSHYDRALSINPFHTRAMNNLGVGLDRRGDTPAALQLYTRALATAPNDGELLTNYGSALISAKRVAEAISALALAIQADPDAPNAHNNLGIALAMSGRRAEAVTRFQEALKLDPNHENARRNLAMLSR